MKCGVYGPHSQLRKTRQCESHQDCSPISLEENFYSNLLNERYAR